MAFDECDVIRGFREELLYTLAVQIRTNSSKGCVSTLDNTVHECGSRSCTSCPNIPPRAQSINAIRVGCL